jgi:hypothetical protein
MYVEMSVVFCLSVCTAATHNFPVGNENFYWELFFWVDGRGGGGNTNKVGQSASNCKGDESMLIN